MIYISLYKNVLEWVDPLMQPTPISTTYTLKVLYLWEVVIELSTACYFAEMASPRIVVQ